MRSLILTALLLLGALGFAQNRDYKKIYQEGMKLLQAGDAQGAIKQFNLALETEAKAQQFKAEGAFFDFYLPRYRLALAYEKIDILEADNWAKKSRDALEHEVIKKKKDLAATYLDDVNRIAKAATDKRKALDADYELRLGDARRLLKDHRFDDAKKALETLYKADPDRSEAREELKSIDDKRESFLKELELDARTALLGSDFRQVEDLIHQIETVDRGYGGLAALKRNLADAKEKSRVAAAPKETPRETPREPVREPVRNANTTPDSKPPVTRPEVQTRPDAAPAQVASRGKDNVRKQLLASLAEYRRGNMDKALAKLAAIGDEGAGFASYHWLRAVYLLQLDAESPTKDPKRQSDAAAAMAKVAELLPQFQPDERLYPAFVISFYQSHKR